MRVKAAVEDLVRRNARAQPFRIGAKIAEAYLRGWWNEGNNDHDRNGEGWLLRTVLAHAQGAPVVLDVGANEGQYGALVRAISAEAWIHCFEIVPEVFAKLSERHAGDPLVKLNPIGLSDASRRVTVQVPLGSSTQMSSIGRPHLPDWQTVDRECSVITGSEYLESNDVTRVDLLKIDTEGHDVNVLRGFAPVLDRIRAIQIEYTKLYAMQGNSLGDVYRLLEERGWSIGRLHPTWVAFDRYNFWLQENFRASNFVAVHPRETRLRAALAG